MTWNEVLLVMVAFIIGVMSGLALAQLLRYLEAKALQARAERNFWLLVGRINGRGDNGASVDRDQLLHIYDEFGGEDH